MGGIVSSKQKASFDVVRKNLLEGTSAYKLG